VEIEVTELPARYDVLFGVTLEEGALAGACFPEDSHVRRASLIREREVASGQLSVHDAEPQSKRTAYFVPLFTSLPPKAVPNNCNELFDKANHLVNCLALGDKIGNRGNPFSGKARRTGGKNIDG
jgi:hypothetical protein